jgi:hypothetical protein
MLPFFSARDDGDDNTMVVIIIMTGDVNPWWSACLACSKP